ncbi:DUF5615 family PIN-like protein [Flavisolibacter sp. BT320]|nr:DUF5615 family PIN-like protein [Flavisolibacter longurius]
MKLLANENFPLLSVIYLREHGYDVVYIGEGLKSIADVMVMELAVAEERTILTFDRDYGELIFRFRVKPPKGVIYLRLRNYLPDEPGKLVHQLLTNGLSPDNKLTVFDGEAVRQRQYG